MLADQDILPFNFFTYNGVFTGSFGNMRYRIHRGGEKPDFSLKANVWAGPLAYPYISEEQKTEREFEYSEEGRMQVIDWINEQYTSRQDEWESAPAIVDADIKL